MLARHVGGAVGRAVVDDEDIRVRKLAVELAEHGREVLLLVPGGDEDERARRHPRRVEERACGDRWSGVRLP